jgi:hypothetical protein
MEMGKDGRLSWGMRLEAIGRDEAAEDRANLNHRPLGVTRGTPVNQPGKRRRKGRFWVPLVWASILPAILTVTATAFQSLLNDLPEQVASILFVAVLLPAVLICEGLGFGKFNIFGGTTIPDWVLFSAMIVVVYLYSLVLVLVVRLIGRLVVRVAARIANSK